MKTSPQFVALVLSLALITASTPAVGQSYSVDNLGTLGGTASRASGINNAGLIVGTAETAAGDDRAFQFINAQISDLGIKGSRSVATSVNATGGIAGYYFDGNYNAFVFINGKQHDLGNLGLKYSVAYAINAAGQVVGYARTAGECCTWGRRSDHLPGRIWLTSTSKPSSRADVARSSRRNSPCVTYFRP